MKSFKNVRVLAVLFLALSSTAQAGMTWFGPAGWFMAGAMMPAVFAPVSFMGGPGPITALPWVLDGNQTVVVKAMKMNFKRDLVLKIREGVYTRDQALRIWDDLARLEQHGIKLGLSPEQLRTLTPRQMIRVLQRQGNLREETAAYLLSISGLN